MHRHAPSLLSSTIVHDRANDLELRPGRVFSVSVHDAAARDDTTIFLTHGAGGNKNQWRYQWTALARTGHRVIAWDLPGHGMSPRPTEPEAYGGTELVADYRALLDRFGTGRNILVAHSYGTLLTLCLAQALWPEAAGRRIAGLALLAPPPPGAALRRHPLTHLPRWLLVGLRPLLGAAFRRAAWHKDTDPILLRVEREATRRNSLAVLHAMIGQAARPDPAALAALGVPVEVLAGDVDRLTPAAGARALVRLLPDARLHVIEHCGHQIMLERPEETNRLIGDLMRRL